MPYRILTNKFTLPQQFQVCPEDVSLVFWNVLHKFVVFELTQLFACQFEVIDVDVFETEFLDGPLYPVTHMSDVPRLGIYRDSQQTSLKQV